ncbi:hypothetical protein Hamer_G004495 [Homarus americanus]|uniref:Uncharacterized protein n=1 Tax=Homarus americanus TaxID=6706 RepID=A0A8J5JXT9_HOMAM|nr:hypothetical protein Hamer_G004495 [Homarus americanus]
MSPMALTTVGALGKSRGTKPSPLHTDKDRYRDWTPSVKYRRVLVVACPTVTWHSLLLSMFTSPPAMWFTAVWAPSRWYGSSPRARTSSSPARHTCVPVSAMVRNYRASSAPLQLIDTVKLAVSFVRPATTAAPEVLV